MEFILFILLFFISGVLASAGCELVFSSIKKRKLRRQAVLMRAEGTRKVNNFLMLQRELEEAE